MPLALLTLNLSLLLEIFFMLLIGMILGLALISMNLFRIFEIILVNTFLYLETKSMKVMVLKNLSAHRESNRLTSTIYALTLGCIIFILVAASLQISIFTSDDKYGQIDLQIYDDRDDSGYLMLNNTDPVLRNYSQYIEEFSYMTISY